MKPDYTLIYTKKQSYNDGRTLFIIRNSPHPGQLPEPQGMVPSTEFPLTPRLTSEALAKPSGWHVAM